MDLSFEAKDGVLYGSIRGPFTLREAVDAFTEVCIRALKLGVTKALVDCQDAVGQLSTIERYQLGEQVAFNCHAITAAMVRVAVIGAPPLVNGFAALVASNRGLQSRTFPNVEEASQWLGIASSAAGPFI
jgi:hypothetical protein